MIAEIALGLGIFSTSMCFLRFFLFGKKNLIWKRISELADSLQEVNKELKYYEYSPTSFFCFNSKTLQEKIRELDKKVTNLEKFLNIRFTETFREEGYVKLDKDVDDLSA